MDEINYILNNNSNSVDTQVRADTDLNILDGINDAIAGLLDLGISNVEDDFYSEHEYHVSHFIDVSQLKVSTDNNSSNLVSDDDTSDGSYVTPDDFDKSSDDDSFDLTADDQDTNIENKREITIAYPKVYTKSLFVTRVAIEMTLSIDTTKITSFERSSQSRNIRKTRFKVVVSKHDVNSNAIQIANNHIQNGDFLILSSSRAIILWMIVFLMKLMKLY